jgi:alkanesulfonate monooxygenase SsuD/methylene tetrahydromethanopterin reductase-like flavin-dependent oxidoreductase (luciferase family)
VKVTNAICAPRPVQQKLRLWIGGQGEKRMLRIVARHADGWNVPFLSPELYAQRNGVLTSWCEKEKRDPRAVIRTANVGLAIGADAGRVRQQEEKLQLMFGGMTDWVKPGHLIGTSAEVVDRIGAYERAGADWVILALRAPFDFDGLDLFIREVMPKFPAGGPA